MNHFTFDQQEGSGPSVGINRTKTVVIDHSGETQDAFVMRVNK